jgi:hypothetical protein
MFEVNAAGEGNNNFNFGITEVMVINPRLSVIDYLKTTLTTSLNLSPSSVLAVPTVDGLLR